MKKAGYTVLILFLLFVLSMITLCGTICIMTQSRLTHSMKLKSTNTIVLDCGHGGPDGGAVGADGTAEKDINLALGFQIKELLEMNGYHVVMTRTKDAFICDDHTASLREQNVSDLHNRLSIAQQYANSVFISLHMNNFGQTQYWGSQLFYGPKNENSLSLAECIRERLLANVQEGNQRPIKEMDKSVYIIYNAPNPALLLECGFMSNVQELNKFKTVEYRSKFAFDVFLGINDYLSRR